MSVKAAMMALFRALDLDLLVCARTYPQQRWQNIAERIMSTLNLALMNVSLCQSALPGEHEAKIKSKKSLTKVRELISRQYEIQTLLRDAMQGVICTSNERFSKMQIKKVC